MIGREAYHNPWSMSSWDEEFFGQTPQQLDRQSVEEAMVQYMQAQAKQGIGWYSIARHMLGLRHQQPGSRKWRQGWSNHQLKAMDASVVSKNAAA